MGIKKLLTRYEKNLNHNKCTVFISFHFSNILQHEKSKK